METLEDKLLEKMASCHFRYEVLKSTATSATALSSWVNCYFDTKSYNKLVDKHIQKNLAILELHIHLLKKAYYPNIQKIKEQIIQEISEKYEIL